MLTAETKLNDVIPVLGFGTWELPGKKCIESVRNALEMGYRHVDTAQMYGNEKEVGKGIKESGVPREAVFVTTKIATGRLEPGKVKPAAHESLQLLGMDYVDLLLIHWPTPQMNLEGCLDAMFELVDEKKVKFVGVSNFSPELFQKAMDYKPVVNNQLKFTPYRTQHENLALAKKTGTTITAYSPLNRGALAGDSLIRQIGEKYSKTPSQVILRWLMQLGSVSVIPKAASENHRKENIEVFDFELSGDDMEAMNRLGR